ncbi:helix-turn-helix domain-containing protein [Kibdelosporangium persicum]|nr:helix-turn-helix transcriptional regulator [Kibdelosporangium persicum]
MAGNKTSTPRGLALGSALREARLAAGYDNLTKFAERLGKTAATLSRWETGQRTPRPEDVAQILTILGVVGERFEDLVALTRNADASSWLAVAMPEQRRHLDALLRFERDAKTIIAVAPLLLPGWLQTPDYIRAIMTAGGVPEDEVESRIAIRLGRREVLRNTEVTAYIGQTALVQQVGGREVLRSQLMHLLEIGEQVDLRVVPFTAGWHPALEGPWYLIQSVRETFVVYLETRRSALFLHEEADIVAYQEAVDMVHEVAMSPQDSKGLIAKEINNLKE